MAEMAEASGGGHKKGGKTRGKKHSTRIDMTPMVDLGFLLVTFFMLATTFGGPKTMELLTPEKPKDPLTVPKVNNKEVLVLLLADKNRIFWYNPPPPGEGAPEVEVTNYSEKGIRALIQRNKKEVAALGRDEKGQVKKLTILIKPTDLSRYKNMVDILDEMNINDVTKYVLTEPEPQEIEMIKNAKEPGQQ